MGVLEQEWIDGMNKQVALNRDVKYTRSELDSLPDETDWERVAALTDEEIGAAASSDPDDLQRTNLSGKMPR